MTGNDAIDQNDMREEDLKALRAYRKKKDNVRGIYNISQWFLADRLAH